MKVRTLFTDLGGVLLTNGWDRKARFRASERFGLNAEEVDERHHLTFDTYEIGRLSLDEYLNRTVFYQERNCSHEEFKQFMFSQSQPLTEMMDMIRTVKLRHGIKIVAISNEGRELADYRVETFRLTDFIDAFVVSGYVYTRKPDASIFNLALDIAQADVEESLYIDDRRLFVEVADGLGLKGIHHTSLESTKNALEMYGLSA